MKRQQFYRYRAFFTCRKNAEPFLNMLASRRSRVWECYTDKGFFVTYGG